MTVQHGDYERFDDHPGAVPESARRHVPSARPGESPGTIVAAVPVRMHKVDGPPPRPREDIAVRQIATARSMAEATGDVERLDPALMRRLRTRP